MEVAVEDPWIYKNPEALDSIKRGLKDIEEGRIKYRGSLAQYVEDKDEENS